MGSAIAVIVIVTIGYFIYTNIVKKDSSSTPGSGSGGRGDEGTDHQEH